MSNNSEDDNKAFLKEVFDQILLISSGECSITEEKILAQQHDEDKMSILAGLQLLYKDLELYKEEYKIKLETDYKLKVQEKKNEDLEQFNFMASHDLKEPLRTIINFSQLLKNNYTKLSPEKINEYLTFINQSTTSMFHLLESLLKYSSASQQVTKVKLDLRATIDNLLTHLSETVKDVTFDISQLPMIHADEGAIKQILQNLITNAIKYKDPQRNLIVKIYGQTNLDEDIICVEDNGIGIPDKYSKSIFELLKRLHNKSDIEGAGVGLSICKKLIQLHSGKIWVESIEGKGSKFFFSIPKYKTEHP